MPWGVLRSGYVSIKTTGSLVNSPHPERRKFYIDISAGGSYFTISPYRRPMEAAVSVLNELKELLELAIPHDLPPFNEYIKFCKYCHVGSDDVKYCLRHQSIVDAPIGNVSNLDYNYNFEIFKTINGEIVKLNFEIGKGWQVNGAVVVDKCYEKPISGSIRVKRPSGIVFTYKLHDGPSTAAYLIQQIIDFINNITNCLTDASHEYCQYWYIYPKYF